MGRTPIHAEPRQIKAQANIHGGAIDLMQERKI